MVNPADPSPAARAVGTLLAPVVACLRGDDQGLGVLLDGAIEEGAVAEAVHAAPAVARVYLRLAPPPDGAERIAVAFPEAARRHFRDEEVVTLGLACLRAARAHEQIGHALAEIAHATFVDVALEHGQRPALESAVASCWWTVECSAHLRRVDPIEEAAAICRYLARVA